LARAYDAVRKVEAEIIEVADQAVDEVGQLVAKMAARVSGWGSESLDGLVNAVETAVSTCDKGRTLEELCSRLFSSVRGLKVAGNNLRTKTEEIDISVLNGSDDLTLRTRDPVFWRNVRTGRVNAVTTNSFFSTKRLKTEKADAGSSI
jgi:hypothetical protein